ncbi:hypothetical protein IU500_21140 [Nocardia terpenica]|uniref:Uncharacterized protein n=1 Tax=Nocardia terpenica TaxID=455432 RepID=A0A164N6L2_9NOCA|nr:hypothetical protein [Nocardia terpenica]KZM74037.1 hypothetical protein AWN90_31435 [Nocardia terpenica]MBF6064210.1 hypothetical protein [Nocardia terpenica]MBF6106543.1 hypothetical protein [Nocardia terpenica]MBF6113828.1 hypothetical protein [Nocardia terpenica]MBF6120548.1 hypothetical protein [Nocardia terpenica]
MVNDVEKSWHDPGMFRQAAGYVASVLLVAALVFLAIVVWASRREPCTGSGSMFCDSASRGAILAGPGAVLVLGTLGAFVATYRVWRKHRAWPIWQGAGWALLTVTLGYLAVGSGVLGSAG